MESNYEVKTQMRSKAALHMFRVDLPMDFVDNINSYIDEELIPYDDNYGKVYSKLSIQGAKLIINSIKHLVDRKPLLIQSKENFPNKADTLN